jgi:hypothetical protein
MKIVSAGMVALLAIGSIEPGGGAAVTMTAVEARSDSTNCRPCKQKRFLWIFGTIHQFQTGGGSEQSPVSTSEEALEGQGDEDGLVRIGRGSLRFEDEEPYTGDDDSDDDEPEGDPHRKCDPDLGCHSMFWTNGCDVHDECGEDHIGEQLAAAMANNDLFRIARLAKASGGKVVINVERGAVQVYDCSATFVVQHAPLNVPAPRLAAAVARLIMRLS